MRALGYAFDYALRPLAQSSYSNTGTTTVVNQMMERAPHRNHAAQKVPILTNHL